MFVVTIILTIAIWPAVNLNARAICCGTIFLFDFIIKTNKFIHISAFLLMLTKSFPMNLKFLMHFTMLTFNYFC